MPLVRVTAVFQSAPPVKGATEIYFSTTDEDGVSIRAPREGGDSMVLAAAAAPWCFNPRPP